MIATRLAELESSSHGLTSSILFNARLPHHPHNPAETLYVPDSAIFFLNFIDLPQPFWIDVTFGTSRVRQDIMSSSQLSPLLLNLLQATMGCIFSCFSGIVECIGSCIMCIVAAISDCLQCIVGSIANCIASVADCLTCGCFRSKHYSSTQAHT
ncbi:hypothetical protein CC2G_004680 [Coprinopsis cinerea AmutBmut pab1-1]|nr:hypothetical protein CC2G_004680 [Coprinopsis cinerea AmutBmut pab1-1]